MYCIQGRVGGRWLMFKHVRINTHYFINKFHIFGPPSVKTHCGQRKEVVMNTTPLGQEQGQGLYLAHTYRQGRSRATETTVLLSSLVCWECLEATALQEQWAHLMWALRYCFLNTILQQKKSAFFQKVVHSGAEAYKTQDGPRAFWRVKKQRNGGKNASFMLKGHKSQMSSYWPNL